MNLEEYHSIRYNDEEGAFIVCMEDDEVWIPYRVFMSMLELKLDT